MLRKEDLGGPRSSPAALAKALPRNFSPLPSLSTDFHRRRQHCELFMHYLKPKEALGSIQHIIPCNSSLPSRKGWFLDCILVAYRKQRVCSWNCSGRTKDLAAWKPNLSAEIIWHLFSPEAHIPLHKLQISSAYLPGAVYRCLHCI